MRKQLTCLALLAMSCPALANVTITGGTIEVSAEAIYNGVSEFDSDEISLLPSFGLTSLDASAIVGDPVYGGNGNMAGARGWTYLRSRRNVTTMELVARSNPWRAQTGAGWWEGGNAKAVISVHFTLDKEANASLFFRNTSSDLFRGSLMRDGETVYDCQTVYCSGPASFYLLAGNYEVLVSAEARSVGDSLGGALADLRLEITAVPLPAAAWFLAPGLIGVLSLSRRTRSCG